MRIGINLASEPFRRDRQMVVASVAVGALLTLLFLFLVSLALAERQRAAESRESMTRTESELARIQKEQAQLDVVLRQPQNAEVLERSLFLNSLLARKGVSWTKIFADLEQVAPHNVRVVQIRPQVTPQNQLLLSIEVASQSVEPILAFMNQLENSPVFGSLIVHNSIPPSQSEPLLRYRLSVNYAQKL